ncbi:hypothetical protein [Microbacterium aurantiacum]|uniref:hypothetical protein n=1 Tax=Microbacterium aurantiacum TaxID=162393 RepID=UPI000C80B7B3|nr:hypothetical protein [Microbacterium aurantiacum]
MRPIEVTLDDRWLLAIPTGDIDSWATTSADTLQSEPDRSRDEIVAALTGFAESADRSAFANLLYCPDGLPGRALVAVYAAATDLRSLEDLPELAPAALPRQVLPLRDHELSTGRVISTVTQVPDVGIVGTLQYELLRDDVLLEVVITSPSLPHLGAGMPVFEELIERIIVGRPEESELVTA